jgi:spore coat protein U-like protein
MQTLYVSMQGCYVSLAQEQAWGNGVTGGAVASVGTGVDFW